MELNDKKIKCVIWDLDNTVWDGILLENDNVKLKPNIIDIIQELDSRGIINSIASRNYYDQAMDKLKEFGIDEYFIYPEINWNAKSISVERIQKNLNIGIDSIMFIDDQVYEREEVRSVHPNVICIDSEKYINMLSLPMLNPKFITEDSRKRRQMYIEDFQREKDEAVYQGPKDEFLFALNLRFIISEAKEEDLRRAEELTVRTNQLNATGETYSYDELNFFRKSKNHKLFVCELIDKYGSYGKIGLALIEMKDDVWYIKLLLMSCRVISRGVGTILLLHIMKEAKESNKRLMANFRHTDRNKQMYITYRFCGFKEISSDEKGNVLLENELIKIQEFPNHINVKVC